MQLTKENTMQSFVPGRVSVITATFNAETLLARCINSVSTQDYPDVEHVIIDGGSSDRTLDVIEQYKDYIGYFTSEKDKGIYDAWNKGVKAATGEWIAFLGSDDEYYPGAISSYMRLAAGHPGTEYMSSQVRWVPAPPEKVKIIGAPWDWPGFQREMRVAHVGSMHHRSLFHRLGLYDLTYRITGDYELLLRAGDTLRTAFLPQVTAEMQAGGTSDSFEALVEAKKAKVLSGGRSRAWASFEYMIKHSKLQYRRGLVAAHRYWATR
ncbi:MAG: glycosyltransferase family 2 protein [Acidobacteriaceae bacterium]|nr:glycosyltransferase family 2 protein [Acidobacteriaceae bacterium]